MAQFKHRERSPLKVKDVIKLIPNFTDIGLDDRKIDIVFRDIFRGARTDYGMSIMPGISLEDAVEELTEKDQHRQFFDSALSYEDVMNFVVDKVNFSKYTYASIYDGSTVNGNSIVMTVPGLMSAMENCKKEILQDED